MKKLEVTSLVITLSALVGVVACAPGFQAENLNLPNKPIAKIEVTPASPVEKVDPQVIEFSRELQMPCFSLTSELAKPSNAGNKTLQQIKKLLCESKASEQVTLNEVREIPLHTKKLSSILIDTKTEREIVTLNAEAKVIEGDAAYQISLSRNDIFMENGTLLALKFPQAMLLSRDQKRDDKASNFIVSRYSTHILTDKVFGLRTSDGFPIEGRKSSSLEGESVVASLKLADVLPKNLGLSQVLIVKDASNSGCYSLVGLIKSEKIHNYLLANICQIKLADATSLGIQ